MTQQPWLSASAVNVLGAQHDMPKHLEIFIPKYNPEGPISPEEHINQLMLSLKFVGFQHEDVVCRIFPYTFDGKTSTWYFSLLDGYITSWMFFKPNFLKILVKTNPQHLW